MNKKIVVAMSGGVDSSVAALKLIEAGYEVTGVVLRMSPLHESAVAGAKRCSRELGIKLYVIDKSNEFCKNIIGDFCKSYINGRTPNPCVICNPLIKFKAVSECADNLGIEQIATGHYANIALLNGGFALAKARSLARDQSYMLYRLPQSILSRLVFPLGQIDKPSVREQAHSSGLASADVPDSQEICFISGNDYPAYINSLGYFGKKGCFILPDGRCIPHRGVEHYTVGQRRGLGVSYSCPLFVSSINNDGDIVLSTEGGEFSSAIRVSGTLFNDFVKPEALTVKVRSAAKNVPCTIERIGSELICRFDTPVRAPAPGQSAVFYSGSYVYGGGFIDGNIEN